MCLSENDETSEYIYAEILSGDKQFNYSFAKLDDEDFSIKKKKTEEMNEMQARTKEKSKEYGDGASTERNDKKNVTKAKDKQNNNEVKTRNKTANNDSSQAPDCQTDQGKGSTQKYATGPSIKVKPKRVASEKDMSSPKSTQLDWSKVQQYAKSKDFPASEDKPFDWSGAKCNFSVAAGKTELYTPKKKSIAIKNKNSDSRKAALKGSLFDFLGEDEI